MQLGAAATIAVRYSAVRRQGEWEPVVQGFLLNLFLFFEINY
jgi:hypothetical protein